MAKHLLLGFLLLGWGLPQAEGRFMDPGDNSALETERPAPVQSPSKWNQVKSWVQSKIKDVKEEAHRRGWLSEDSAESIVEKAREKQERAGVEPATENLNVLDDSYTAEQVQQVTQSLKGESGLRETPGRPGGSAELEASPSGVPRYVLSQAAGPNLPRLEIGQERRLDHRQFKVQSFDMKRITQDMSLKLPSEPALTSKEENYLAGLSKDSEQEVKTFEVEILTSRQLDELREAVASLKVDIQVLADLSLIEFVPFSTEDRDLLSALILILNNKQCSAAVSLLHRLTKIDSHADEAYFYLAGCQKELGLTSESLSSATELLKRAHPEFAAEVVSIVGYQVPYEHLEPYAQQLLRAVTNPELKIMDEFKRAADVAMILSEYGLVTGRYKIAHEWSGRVPKEHPRYTKALYMQAVAEYSLGQQAKSIQTQERLLEVLKSSPDGDIKTLAAINLGRFQFQSGEFHQAQKSLHQVDKKHPLWIQSLLEMGWSQLQYGDYSGAIGNMYSIHSPFFQFVYKPESYVVRTIGYLNLCQYADAYRTLSTLEKDYRPWLAHMQTYIKENAKAKGFYQTVRNYLRSDQVSHVDGLPPQVIREMARHRDFLNLQNSLNRNVDEKRKLASLDGEIKKNLSRSRHLIRSTRERLTKLNAELSTLSSEKKSVKQEPEIRAELRGETERLASYEYILKIHERTQELLPPYVATGTKRADRVIAVNRAGIEKTLAKRLYKMRDQLVRILENNEFLRYEVFSGSGENIRFELAGGEKAGKRVPANVMPKSKELRWSFDGEYWADEIGHYRSSLKSNCPQTSISMGR